jgi:hypothetical protein
LRPSGEDMGTGCVLMESTLVKRLDRFNTRFIPLAERHLLQLGMPSLGKPLQQVTGFAVSRNDLGLGGARDFLERAKHARIVRNAYTD